VVIPTRVVPAPELTPSVQNFFNADFEVAVREGEGRGSAGGGGEEREGTAVLCRVAS
jgi:hypothetical protein